MFDAFLGLISLNGTSKVIQIIFSFLDLLNGLIILNMVLRIKKMNQRQFEGLFFGPCKLNVAFFFVFSPEFLEQIQGSIGQ